MLEQYEPSLPAMAMTRSRRHKLAVWGSAALLAAGVCLWALGAGPILWGAWALSGLVIAGKVVLQPSVIVDMPSPEETFVDYEYRKSKKYMKALEKADFAPLEEFETVPEELSA